MTIALLIIRKQDTFNAIKRMRFILIHCPQRRLKSQF